MWQEESKKNSSSIDWAAIHEWQKAKYDHFEKEYLQKDTPLDSDYYALSGYYNHGPHSAKYMAQNLHDWLTYTLHTTWGYGYKPLVIRINPYFAELLKDYFGYGKSSNYYINGELKNPKSTFMGVDYIIDPDVEGIEVELDS